MDGYSDLAEAEAAAVQATWNYDRAVRAFGVAEQNVINARQEVARARAVFKDCLTEALEQLQRVPEVKG